MHVSACVSGWVCLIRDMLIIKNNNQSLLQPSKMLKRKKAKAEKVANPLLL